MNDYISILKKDLLDVIDNLIKNNIVNQDFKKDNLTIDYLSKSKQGEVSTNLFILLNSQLNKNDYDLRKNIHKNIINFEYVKKIEITKVGFINIFFEEDFIIKKLFFYYLIQIITVITFQEIMIKLTLNLYQLTQLDRFILHISEELF